MPESELEDSKENQSPRGGDLPYRSVFAVLTLDSVLVYDTHHDRPLAVARGLHYAGLTDCCWSQDGQNLIVCSTDGYISVLSFEDGELGKVYTPPPVTTSLETKEEETEEPVHRSTHIVPPEDLPTIPPCEPGQSAVLEAPPTKRAKKTRVTPTLVSAIGGETTIKGTTMDSSKTTPTKRALAAETESVGDAVNKMTLDNAGTADAPHQLKPVKKKKRIQPLLISN
jgi:chromatin assembly factor 1 subunit B